MYTIGVIADVGPIINGKSGKLFSCFKLTDLVKYDLKLVTKAFQDSLEKK